MNKHIFNILEIEQIKEQISAFALTKEGREKIVRMVPSTNRRQIETWLDEVFEAVEILKKSASVPVHGLDGMEHLLNQLNKGITSAQNSCPNCLIS